MTRDLPLRALRVFHTCGTLGSFTRAAKALQVTQTAVSHQVALLERHLGVRLFRRSHRGAELTAEGQSYLLAVSAAFSQLEQASFRLRVGRVSGQIACSIATTIAMRWLVPRLRSFYLTHPDLTVQLGLTERYVDFTAENVDIAIRYGEGRWEGLVADLLFREMLVPVCSPELLRGRNRLTRIERLREQTLLHAAGGRSDWREWLAKHRVEGVDTEQGLVFDQPHLALQAAAEGLGVAMADQTLAQPELASGRLVKPFDSALSRSAGYYVVGRPAARDSAQVGPFWRWLLAEAAVPAAARSTKRALR